LPDRMMLDPNGLFSVNEFRIESMFLRSSSYCITRCTSVLLVTILRLSYILPAIIRPLEVMYIEYSSVERIPRSKPFVLMIVLEKIFCAL
jgi:hypothetical protein